MSTLDLHAVPLFPLPNVVLFPRAILPLHIFEERYIRMTADALEGNRTIAIALLKTGWEEDYYGHPEIQDVVCVGQIVSWEQLSDGRYNFLLQGLTRARIVREHAGAIYRTAELAPVGESQALEIDLEDYRRQLLDIFASEKLAALPVAGHFLELVRSHLSTPAIVDIIAFTLLEDVEVKQALLEEPDILQRIRYCLEMLGYWARRHAPGTPGDLGDAAMN